MSEDFRVEIYQGIEVILDNDYDPWMTQKQIAQLLGVPVNTVTKAISRAFQ
jgi:DNA-directed RNA polymerase specialized sigma24 family protein